MSPSQLQQLQQLQQMQRTGQPAGTLDTTPQPDVTLQPAVPAAPMAMSRLEQIQSERAGVRLEQFGYDQLGRGSSVVVPQTGAVQDDYILGPGDELLVDLRGQENSAFRVMVDRNGQVVLPRLPPIPATGRSFGSFRADLEAAVHRAYVASDASVSIGKVRQISVTVSGEVNNPGQRLVTGLSSAVDALLLSGGVKKTGSLRNVRVRRGGREFTLDLYGVLTAGGQSGAMRLADGDRILVPALGATVAVTGLVRRPGIYELPAHSSSTSARALIALAGGEEVRGNYRISLLRILPDGRSDLSPAADTVPVHDSELLFVALAADQTVGQATLAGGSQLAGRYPIQQGTRLSTLLRAPGALGTAPYTLFGIIARKDARTQLRQLMAFTPVAVLNGGEDIPLESDDIVRILSVTEVRSLTAAVTAFSAAQEARDLAMRDPASILSTGSDGGGTAADTSVPSPNASAISPNVSSTSPNASATSPNVSATSPNASITAAIASTSAANSGGNMDTTDLNVRQASQADQIAAQTFRSPNNLSQPPANFQREIPHEGRAATNVEAFTLMDLSKQLGVDNQVLASFMRDHQASLEGAVRGPGTYFVGGSAQLQDLVQAAGGTVGWADESGVEVITTLIDPASGASRTQRVTLPLRQGTLSSYLVRPHDEIHFNQVFTDSGVGQVVIQGQLRHPGTYSIIRGEHLSDVLIRAGGLTNEAYPYGTVFLRKSAAATERESYIRAAREMDEQLIVAMSRSGNSKVDPQVFVSLRAFVAQLRNQPAIGRVSLIADPSVLASKPELDPLLEPGDVIYVPQRPSTVAVLGQVMQSGSYPYRGNATVEDYLRQAGGFARNADDSNIFVVLPNGTAQKVDQSLFNFSNNRLPPGSAIVVPRDIAPFDLRQTILDVSTILGQLAVSLASVAVLSKQ